ncbi:MAG: dihydropteroate synthase [Gemmobacter sp.]
MTALHPASCAPALPGLPPDRPAIMGILNVTPDSFSDGGAYLSPAAAVAHGRAMLEAGADIIDVGGESTRPFAAPVEAGEEIARTAFVIAALRASGVTAPISIDTRKAAVAEAAFEAGASILNDVTALTHDPAMASLAARRGVPVILMHAQGTPETMQIAPHYSDVVAEVAAYLAARIAAATAAGIDPARIAIDPGIGFGKTAAHNLALLRAIPTFAALGHPVLIGASRKGFVGAIGGFPGQPVPGGKARMPGSVAVALHAARAGARILRVHDVAETVQALRLQSAIERGAP